MNIDRNFVQFSTPLYIKAGIYDPELFAICEQACLDATNDLILDYYEEEEQWEALAIQLATGSTLACSLISAFPGGIGLAGYCFGVEVIGVGLVIAAIESYYQGLRQAANTACVACVGQCAELYLDIPE